MTPYVVSVMANPKVREPGQLLPRAVFSVKAPSMFDAILKAEAAVGEGRWRSTAWRFEDAPPAVRDEAVALAG